MSRLEGSRWRLRRAREMRPAMEFEWVFFRLLFGAKCECRHFRRSGEETQIPPHTWRILTRSVPRASGFVLADHPLGMRRLGMARVSSTSPLHGVCKILVNGTKISAELTIFNQPKVFACAK